VQSLLARSGVFVGGWTLEAAERVAWDDGRSALTALDALTSLVTNSLVVGGHYGGAPRFTLLETIRAYALERLAERDEEETVRQRHAEYYLQKRSSAEDKRAKDSFSPSLPQAPQHLPRRPPDRDHYPKAKPALSREPAILCRGGSDGIRTRGLRLDRPTC
jgi:hypothetical protein